jgi:hypothetical protein
MLLVLNYVLHSSPPAGSIEIKHKPSRRGRDGGEKIKTVISDHSRRFEISAGGSNFSTNAWAMVNKFNVPDISDSMQRTGILL